MRFRHRRPWRLLVNCDRTAVNTGKRDAYTVSERRNRRGRLPESRDHSFETTPHPAYGSELSTGGGRLVRALTAMEPARHPFPVSSTAPYYRRTKSESQGVSATPLLSTLVKK